jgi:O-acetyl-ADP-ribose deacetylase (regulator of RNase III)
MGDDLAISKYLDAIHADWIKTRERFPDNTRPRSRWPIAFFGNPTNATVATIGINPSSTEFDDARKWSPVKSKKAWKIRLRDYFKNPIPPHVWFESWRPALALLGASYKDGTATHLDVSYRATTAMLKNPQTNPTEFRQMSELDVKWLFKLLPLCQRLKLLLTVGPIVTKAGGTEPLINFLATTAAAHGFKVSRINNFKQEWRDANDRSILIHDAAIPGRQAAKYIKTHLAELQQLLNPARNATITHQQRPAVAVEQSESNRVMIKLTPGNLLAAPAEALVNTVNTVGVMGRGIALQFKKAYPSMFREYVRACKAGEVNLGKMHVFDLGTGAVGARWIINFPTKGHWRTDSRLADIEAGLKDLVATIRQLRIRSIAIPALGCGNGGLEWNEVLPRIETALSELPDVEALIYSPAAAP